VHELHDRLIEIRRALDDLGAVTNELAAVRGRKEAERILTDLLEEIHQLPDALAAAIAPNTPTEPATLDTQLRDYVVTNVVGHARRRTQRSRARLTQSLSRRSLESRTPEPVTRTHAIRHLTPQARHRRPSGQTPPANPSSRRTTHREHQPH
jgi:hypothetical protein